MTEEGQYTDDPKREGGGLGVAAGPLVGLGGLAACVGVGLIIAGFIANAEMGSRATQRDIALAVERLIGTWSFLLSVAAPSLLFFMLGGYVAARAAGTEEAWRGLPVWLTAVAATALLIFITPAHVPAGIVIVLLAAPLPAALIGVGLRKLVARRAQLRESEPAMRPEPRFPRPPAHSLEEEREYAAQVADALARRGQLEESQQWTHLSPARAESYAAAPPEKLEALEGLRAAVRAALMTHPAATDEDFERCWPSIRDEIFKQHTLRVYNSRVGGDNGKH